MRVWVVTIGEPLFYNSALRAHRSGLLVKSLFKDERVKEVIWWTSAFDHFNKKSVYSKDNFLQLNPKCKVYALDGGGYRKNVSISRIIDHNRIKSKFRKRASEEVCPPDVIVTSFPTLGLCEVVSEYAEERNIPYYIDYRDMWPEVFIEVVPPRFAPLMRFLLSPLFNRTKTILSRADGLISITDELLTTILAKVDRVRGNADAVFPLAYELNELTDEQLALSHDFWFDNVGLSRNKDILRFCFFGSIGYQFDFDTIINSVEKLEDVKVEFIFCGSGDRWVELMATCQQYDNVFFPGYIDYLNVRGLMSISDIGLCPYVDKEAFLKSIPGKGIEYLSGGLPLMTSLKHGVLGEVARKNGLGLSYEPGNKSDFIASVYKCIEAKNTEIWQHDYIKEYFMKNFDSSVIFSQYCNHILNKDGVHK